MDYVQETLVRCTPGVRTTAIVEANGAKCLQISDFQILRVVRKHLAFDQERTCDMN